MKKIILWLCGLLLCGAAAGGGETVTESSGSPVLDRMRKCAVENNMTVYSICEIKDGVSRTVDIVPSSNCHNCYSVAKVFVVTAIGILEDRGLLSTEEPVYPIFKDQFPEGFDPKWKEVKISDLMRHRVGFEHGFLDIDCENITEYGTDDFLSIVLARPLKYRPGEKAVYSDAAYYLLSRVVSAKSGKNLDDFLIEEVLAPMHFREYAFSKCPYGYPVGATGLYITTSDMAKIGQLYLQKGVFDGKRILSERFVDKALGTFELLCVADGGYAKAGMLGQYLYLNPRDNRVIAIHSYNGALGRLMACVTGEEKNSP